MRVSFPGDGAWEAGGRGFESCAGPKFFNACEGKIRDQRAGPTSGFFWHCVTPNF